MSIFADVQYYIYVDLGGFQLEFVSISRVINHMICYRDAAGFSNPGGLAVMWWA